MPTEGYNETLDGDFVHQDDIIDLGRMRDGVRYISIDRNAVYNRNIGYLRESIALAKKHQKELVQ